MRSDLTDITVVLDRSGSMASCKPQAEKGLNHFIKEQKQNPGEAVFTLVQFDTEYEFVHNAVPMKDVPTCDLVPRGGTALLDAVGRAMNETGKRLSDMKEEDRPGLVVFVVLTDGEENSSHEFNRKQIRDMIEHQQNVYNWQFTYLGANVDAFAEAQALGIKIGSTANYKAKNADVAFASAANNVTRMRCATYANQAVASNYSDEERDLMSK